jgi:peptide deformylase
MLPIVQVGDPVLRRVGASLAPADLPSLASLIDEMRETMRHAPGVGLAAPQIGRSVQLAVVEDRAEYQEGASRAELAEREREPVPFHVLINPKLTITDPTPMVFFEGCLSVEGYVALVPRARAVRVEALDEEGRRVVIDARGWYARILQHEIDHLNGTVYIDRMLTRSFATHEGFSQHLRGRPLDELRAILGLP